MTLSAISADATSGLLGPTAAALVHAIVDDQERTRVVDAIVTCGDALRVVDALDLEPHEKMDSGGADLSVWEALAPDVRNVLMAVRSASEKLIELYPANPLPTASLDIEFDITLDNEGMPRPIRDQRDVEVDAIVQCRSEAVTAEAIASLAFMLQRDFVQFGQRLRNPRVTADRWFLLGELQEMRTKCTQCLEAVVATVLSQYTSEDLETVLPRYATATRRAIALRTMVVDLSFDVSRLNQALAGASVQQAGAILHALKVRLEVLGSDARCSYLRPQDKRTIIDFRSRIAEYSDLRTVLLAFKRDVEGLSKFLEVMRAINQREVLVQHDRSRLQTVRMLLESEVGIEEVQGYLEDVYGRWPTLDDFVRSIRRQRYPAGSDVLPVVLEAQESLRE